MTMNLLWGEPSPAPLILGWYVAWIVLWLAGTNLGKFWQKLFNNSRDFVSKEKHSAGRALRAVVRFPFGCLAKYKWRCGREDEEVAIFDNVTS